MNPLSNIFLNTGLSHLDAPVERHPSGGLTGRILLAARPLAAAAALIGSALTANGQTPPGCVFTVNAPMLIVDRPGLANEIPFAQGQVLRFTVEFTCVQQSCMFEGGQIGVTFPNGQFVHVAGYPATQVVPPIWPGQGPTLMAAPITYTVHNADVVNGALQMRLDYGSTPQHPEQVSPVIHNLLNAQFSYGVAQAIAICTADVYPASGGDGRVNIDDLVTVISAWGTTGMVRADITGNSMVNVDDLVRVITAWGVCH